MVMNDVKKSIDMLISRVPDPTIVGGFKHEAQLCLTEVKVAENV